MNKYAARLLALSHTMLLAVPMATSAQDNFFANAKIQSQSPKAFAIQPASKAFIDIQIAQTRNDADKLVAAILANKPLKQALSKWQTLSIDEQIPYLKEIFKLEYQTQGYQAPNLVIDNHSYQRNGEARTVYFDFDVNKPSNGTVYLNPEKLEKMGPFAALAFLIHETRHGYQFQHAFKHSQSIAGKAYKAAFTAQQKSPSGSLGFCDFLTLNNEYEAFQFGNLVVGKLTQWQASQKGMGTYASQFNEDESLKINLKALHNDSATDSVLERFNTLEKTQKAALNR